MQQNLFSEKNHSLVR